MWCCEDMLAKWCHWEALPHLLLGLYPNDDRSVDIARNVLRQWAHVEGTPAELRCHRVTYRIVHPRILRL